MCERVYDSGTKARKETASTTKSNTVILCSIPNGLTHYKPIISVTTSMKKDARTSENTQYRSNKIQFMSTFFSH